MKTTYERFIEANHKLIKCFEAVNQEKWSKLSGDEQGQLCHVERDAVKSFLATNQVGFAALL